MRKKCEPVERTDTSQLFHYIIELRMDSQNDFYYMF